MDRHQLGWGAWGFGALLVATTTAAQCCDAKHDGYAAMETNMKTCVERGGVPITTAIADDGGHVFQVLTHCSFPCEDRPAERVR